MGHEQSRSGTLPSLFRDLLGQVLDFLFHHSVYETCAEDVRYGLSCFVSYWP